MSNPSDALADVRKAQRERQSDVAAADDADLEVLACKKFRFALHIHSLCLLPASRFEQCDSLKLAMIAGVRKQVKETAQQGGEVRSSGSSEVRRGSIVNRDTLGYSRVRDRHSLPHPSGPR